MAKRRSVIALGVLLACSSTGFALNPSLDISQYAHTQWSVRDGFFKGMVTSVTQTPDGYLWLGTEVGLLRFDGVQAVPWQPPTDPSLSGSSIRRLLVTRDGRLWIGTTKGLFSWKDSSLTSYPRLAQNEILALAEDREGTVWAGGRSAGIRWPASIGRLCAIRHDHDACYGEDGSLGHGVFSIYEERRGDLWIGADTGLWHRSSGTLKHYPVLVIDPFGIAEDHNGVLLVATKDGIRQLGSANLEKYRLPAASRPFVPSRLLSDRDGGIWVSTTDHGLVHIHHGKTDSFSRADGLSSDTVLGHFEDREGNIWIATDSGLDRFRDFAVPTISVKQGLSSATVWSVLAATDGSVWLGTPSGLNRWKDGQVTTFRKQSDGLPDNSIQSLFQDDSGRIWVSTSKGLVYFEHGRFIPINDVPDGNANPFAPDPRGGFWISHRDRELVRVLGEHVAERVQWPQPGRKDLASALMPDPEGGGLWVGLFAGGIIHLQDGQIRRTYGSADALGQGGVAALRRDPDGSIWAATQGGLSRIVNGRVATLSSRNGLPCDAVYWEQVDDSNALWLGMACGIVRINRTDLDAWARNPASTIQTTVFDGSDGVRSRQSPYNPRVAKSRDGKIWLSSLDGVGVIDPQHLPFNKLAPPVHIEQITADRKPYVPTSHLSLPPLVHDLEIDYTALSLAAPEKIRFRAMLEGHDSGWKDVGNQRKAFYSDLPPRNYRFRVVACNNNGVWNEAGASLDFAVAPAYFQTRWFQASCAATFLALLTALYRLRLHQIAREFNMRLAERVDERTRLARDLHDTLLQGFQGLILRLQALEELLPEGEAKVELEQTLDRADQVVTESRKAVHDLRLSTVGSNDLAPAVKAMGDELSSENSATIGFLVEGQVRELHPIVRDEVYRITREALRNAFRHARARHIEVEIIYDERLFRLRIRDDGEGIAPAILEEGRPGHYGVPGMRERAAGIGATLDIWSGVGTGTEIDLNIAGLIAYSKRAGGAHLRAFVEKE